MAAQTIELASLLKDVRSLGVNNDVVEFVPKEEREKNPDLKPPVRMVDGLPLCDVSVMTTGRDFGREVAAPLEVRVPVSEHARQQLVFGATIRFEGLTISMRDGDGRQRYVTFNAARVIVLNDEDSDADDGLPGDVLSL